MLRDRPRKLRWSNPVQSKNQKRLCWMQGLFFAPIWLSGYCFNVNNSGFLTKINLFKSLHHILPE